MSYKTFSVKNSEMFEDVYLFSPEAFIDHRGSIYTSYLKDIIDEYIPHTLDFAHDKFVVSKCNVLRGLHGDNKTWKLVSCISGQVFQVVVDYRPNSKTYMKWEAFHIDSQNRKQVLVPPGFANGFYVMQNTAIYHYKLAYSGKYNDAKDQFTLKWNHPELAINWPSNNPILSIRDK